MTSQAQVPDELWVEVFKYLPKTCLRDVSSTYRTFSRISRPLVFSDFDFHPYAVGAGDRRLLPSATEVKRSFERLNFWCSPEIAPLVRSCKITAWVWYPRTFSDTETPYILLAAFFDRLSCFARLQTLYALCIDFTQIGVVGLCRLPVLTRLHIVNCIVAARERANTTALSLKVSSFILEREREGVDHWITLLDPDYLREMDVELSSHVFARTVANRSPFPHVHKLSAIMDNSLTMRWGGADPTVHISGLLPALTEYTGPCNTLCLFLPRETLTHLVTPRCLPADFLRQLEGIGTPHNIPSLDLTFDDFDRAALDKLCRFFPRLTDLQITIIFGGEDSAIDDGANPKPTTFCHALATSPALPPTLKNLAISWYYEGEDQNIPPVDESDFAPLRDALVARCPALTSLRFDGHKFLFRWRKGLDGTVNEATAGDYVNTGSMQEDIAAFWSTMRADMVQSRVNGGAMQRTCVRHDTADRTPHLRKTSRLRSQRALALSTSRARSDLRRQPPPAYVYFVIGIQCIARRRDEINGHRARIGPVDPLVARPSALAPTLAHTSRVGRTERRRDVTSHPSAYRPVFLCGWSLSTGWVKLEKGKAPEGTMHVRHTPWRTWVHAHEMGTPPPPPHENETTLGEHGTEVNRTSDETEDAGAHPDSLQLPAADHRAKLPRHAIPRSRSRARPATHHPLRQSQHADSAESAIMEEEEKAPAPASTWRSASSTRDTPDHAEAAGVITTQDDAPPALSMPRPRALYTSTPTAAPTLAPAPASAAA
ncbi:hypothetical protein DFH09DRAFT_1506527 [Mycena vulgaris]|nr:hypothetical protein DFH09DRAFT_1506527 [Mycena vulgaris]